MFSTFKIYFWVIRLMMQKESFDFAKYTDNKDCNQILFKNPFFHRQYIGIVRGLREDPFLPLS